MSFNLICMSFDGEYVTENKRDEKFETIADAWERSSDMGSRWFFYPFHFITTESGRTIADAPDGLEIFTGRRVETVAGIFAEVSRFPEMVGADCDLFGFEARDIAEQKFKESLHEIARAGQKCPEQSAR